MKAIREYVFADQILRSGTSIGANAVEANSAMTKKEFIYKLNISLKEAKECSYWLRLLRLSHIEVENNLMKLTENSQKLEAILTKIIKSTKNNYYSN